MFRLHSGYYNTPGGSCASCSDFGEACTSCNSDGCLDCLEGLLHGIEQDSAEFLHVLLLDELRDVPLEALGERQRVAEERVARELHFCEEPLQLVGNRVLFPSVLRFVVAAESLSEAKEGTSRGRARGETQAL